MNATTATQLLPLSDKSASIAFDAVDSLIFDLADKALLLLLTMPLALREVAIALLNISRASAIIGFQALIIACAVLTGFVVVRRALARARKRASQHVVPFFALIKQTAYELLPIMIAVMIGRVLLVRWLNLDPWAATYQTEVVVALVRWLMAIVVARLLFQPSSPALRLVGVDDAGAIRAVFWLGALFAFGHAHQVMLNAALRDNFPATSAKSLTVLAALLIVAGTIKLFHQLRRHGLALPLFRSGLVALIGLATLWIWGAVSGGDDLFKGAIRATAIIVLAWSFDRMLALSITASRRPATMRRLFVVRVLTAAVALALLARVLAEFWFSGILPLFGSLEQTQFLRRLNLAALLFVGGLWLSALVQVWVEAKIAPIEGESLTPGEISLRARLSTILPIIRFSAISLILLMTGLAVFSILGVDITPLMGAAGILGLAISLGSQTLVKDIVSGLFYMFDDVFRVGETIESSTLSGQIEKISTRAVRLRDTRGRLHTIAFGDLGTITNHSRRLVRINVEVCLPHKLEGLQIKSILRQLVSSLRSEKLLQSQIVGPIETRNIDIENSNTIMLSFVIGAAVAAQAEQLTKYLLVSELDEGAVSRGNARIETTIIEISNKMENNMSPHPI